MQDQSQPDSRRAPIPSEQTVPADAPALDCAHAANPAFSAQAVADDAEAQQSLGPAHISMSQLVKNAVAYIAGCLGACASIVGVQYVVGFVYGLFILTMNRVIADSGFSYAKAYNEGVTYALVVAQFISLAILLCWWRHIRYCSFSMSRRKSLRGGGATLQRVVGVILLGLGLQGMTSFLLDVILPLIPSLLHNYNEAMESSGLSEFSFITVLASTVLAPISEEIALRGLTLEFLLRLLCPEQRDSWARRQQLRRLRLPLELAPELSVEPLRFWIANVIQAIIFGILHGNVVQSIYTFAVGLVLGWMVYRTGRLRFGIGVHLVLNFSGYFINVLFALLAIFGLIGQFAGFVLIFAVGLILFIRGTAPKAGAGLDANA